MEPATRGLGGDEKFAVSGKESAGVFDVTFRFDPTAKRMLSSFRTRSLTGLDPTDSLPGLYFLTLFGPPYRMQMRYRNGPPIDKTLFPITEPILKEPDQVLEICEALATIQGQSCTPIVIPDFATTTNGEADEWMTAARLLRGDAIGFTWNHVDIVSNGDLAFGAGDAYNIETQEPLTVTISGTVIDLGFKLFHLEAARVATDQVGVQPGLLRLEPAANDAGWTVWQRETFFPDHIETAGNPVRGRLVP